MLWRHRPLWILVAMVCALGACGGETSDPPRADMAPAIDMTPVADQPEDLSPTPDATPDDTPDSPDAPAEMGDAPGDMIDAPDDMIDAPDDMGALPGALVVATFNVERLFDQTCNSGNCGPNDFEGLPSQAELDAKLATLHAAIATLDADVLMLQEIETEAMLDAALGPHLLSYPARAFGATDSEGRSTMDVAVVARGTHIETRKHRRGNIPDLMGGNTQFVREVLEVHVDFDGMRVIAFGAHLNSKASDLDGTRRRIPEATAIAQLMKTRRQEYPDAMVVLGGDLNDSTGSATLQAFYDQDIQTVVEGLPVLDVFTYRYLEELDTIDHILYIKPMPLVLDVASVEAVRDPGLETFGGSDHAAMRATFNPAP